MAQLLRTMAFVSVEPFKGTNSDGARAWNKVSRKGPFKMATAASNPGLVALGWVVNKPVYFLRQHPTAREDRGIHNRRVPPFKNIKHT